MSYHEVTVDRKICCVYLVVIVVIVINNQLLVISELECASELALYNLEVLLRSQCRHRTTRRGLQATNYYAKWTGQSQL